MTIRLRKENVMKPVRIKLDGYPPLNVRWRHYGWDTQVQVYTDGLTRNWTLSILADSIWELLMTAIQTIAPDELAENIDYALAEAGIFSPEED